MILYIFLVGCVVALVSLSSFILLMYQLYCNESNRNIQKQWYKIPPILSSAFYLLSCIFYLMFAWHLSPNINTKLNNLQLTLISSALATSILCAKLFIYITFLSRLYFTFCDSAQAVPTKIMQSITMLLIIFFLCVIWWNVLLLQRYILKSDENIIIYKPQFIIVFALFVFCDITSYTVMLYLFLKKLFLLITNRRRTIIWKSIDKQKALRTLSTVSSITDNGSGTGFGWKLSRSLTPMSPSGLALKEYASNNVYYGKNTVAGFSGFSYSASTILEYSETKTSFTVKSNDENKNENGKSGNNIYKKEVSLRSNNLDTGDMTIMDAMTRYTILNIITMITSQLGFLSFFVIGLIQYLYDLNENENVFVHYSMYIVIAGLYPLDVITNCMVIYMSFKFGKFVYYKLCERLHDFCQLKYALKIEQNLKTFEQPEIVSPTKNPSYFVLEEDVNRSLQTNE